MKKIAVRISEKFFVVLRHGHRCFAPFAAIALLACSFSFAHAQAHNAAPPLIDRELFFGDPEISGAQISPDGKFIAFIKPFNGTRNIWVKRADEPFDRAKPLTNDMRRPIRTYFWTRDGKYILFSQDKGGDENFNIYAVNPSDAPAAGEQVPPARNLTELKNVRAVIYDAPKTDADVIYVGLNDRDPAWHDLYKIKISTGDKTLLRKNTERISEWVFDNAGNLRLAARTTDKGDTEILRVDANGFTRVYSCSVFETCAPVRFHKDGKRVYMETNRGDDVDLVRLVLFDTETGKEEIVESDPMKRVDFGGARFSDLTDELIATTYVDERERIYWRDKKFEADYKLLEKKLPNKEINFTSSTKDERLWLISAYSDTDPGAVYLFDRQTKNLTPQYRLREKLPREALAEMRAIRYKSSDGLEIPAYLVLPKGVAAKNLPLIVFPHGGPWARDTWGYNTFAQFLANRGYAVLMPNFRSSTGYGKRFLNAGNRQWGQLMQDDLTWGVKHLIAEGIADPKRVGIMGGSYGGYATLAGVAFTPDLYAAAVAIVAPSNLITLLETIPPYWEAGRIIFYERMGNPTTPEGKAQLMKQSPLNSADKIKTPLMVVQGANDPRVNKREADQIVIALRDRGYPVEYLVAPDEGHGFARPVNNMAMIAAAERFLAQHLGGRYQETMTPEVAARLKEITVDVKTVSLPKKIDAARVTVPQPALDLQPGRASYQAKYEVGGQTIPVTTTTEIIDDNGKWLIKDSAQTPMGAMSDTTVLEKKTLILSKRTIKQPNGAIELAFNDNKATGAMMLGNESRPVSVDLGGALFADGGGAYAALAALPLAEGYTTQFRNFDVMRQKPRIKELRVTGVEQVTIPAGTFEAYKLEITAADGENDKTTVWIAKDTRRVLKIVATIPQLNNATFTSELIK
jgi:dipeptidyl aminopeptidase/acylaminoacyl peptidase